MKKFLQGTLVVAVLAAVAYGVHAYWQSTQVQPAAPPTQPTPPPSQAALPEPSPPIQYPVPSQEPEAAAEESFKKPIPPLDESDETFEDALIRLIGKERLDALFNLTGIVRRIVVTVDNLAAQRRTAAELSPMKELDTEFAVSRAGQSEIISGSNFDRYAPFVTMVNSIDTRRLVSVYVHFYSLFQAAYKDQSQHGYFNDRLVQVIDNLLQTPYVKSPIPVARLTEQTRYRYVDDQVESLSVGQKLLIRMGDRNSAVLKAKLKELRARLVRAKVPHGK